MSSSWDFLQKELPLPVETLGRSKWGQISSKIRFLFIPSSWGIALQKEDAPVPAEILGRSMSGDLQ